MKEFLFYEAMVLKLCRMEVISAYYGVCVKFFLQFRPFDSGSNYWEEFLNCGTINRNTEFGKFDFECNLYIGI